MTYTDRKTHMTRGPHRSPANTTDKFNGFGASNYVEVTSYIIHLNYTNSSKLNKCAKAVLSVQLLQISTLVIHIHQI